MHFSSFETSNSVMPQSNQGFISLDIDEEINELLIVVTVEEYRFTGSGNLRGLPEPVSRRLPELVKRYSSTVTKPLFCFGEEKIHKTAVSCQ